MRTLLALLTLRVTDLTRRPASALAAELAVDVSVAHRHLRGLKEAGLVEARGRYGVCILAPEDGWIFHRHSEQGFCAGRCEDMVLDAATARTAAREHFAPQYKTCHRYKMSGQMGLKDAVRQIKGKIEVNERKRGRLSSSDRTAMLLLGHYTKARRRWVGGYSPTQGDRNKVRKVVKNLADRMIGQDLFARYVEHAFETFPRIVKGERAPKYPPVAFLSSETIIDGFAASLGRRKVDVDKAAILLEAAGIKADASIAVMIARNCMEEGLEIPETLNDDMREAVEFVVDRFAEIGYRPEET